MMENRTALTVAPGTSVEPRLEEVGGISEITILPDGRLYVLGLSARVLEVVNAAGPWDSPLPDGRPRRRAERGEQQGESSR